MTKTLLMLALSVSIGSCTKTTTSESGPDVSLTKAMGLIAVTSPSAGVSSRGNRELHLFSGTPENVKPLEEMKSDLQEVRDGNPEAQAASLGNPLSFLSARAACYGPTWTDDAVNPGGATTNRPSGDLGISYATASNTDPTACVAAQLNALLSGTPSLVNNLVKMQAIMIASAVAAGKTLPAVGETQDETENMPDISGLTISAATLTRLADADGKDVFKTVISFTDVLSNEGTVTIYHTPLNDDNTNFKGLFQATVPANGNAKRGISMVYSNEDNVFTFSFSAAANQGAANSDFFDTDGQVDFNKAAFGQDGHYMLGYFNTNTNESRAHYAWQAGKMDGATRTFGIHIPAGTAGSLTGTGYAGFGDDIKNLTSTGTPWTASMACNWVNTHTSIAKVQKQTMVQSSGNFVVDTNNFDFAPTTTCNPTNTWTVTSADAAFLNGARANVAHSLVDVPTSAELPAITVPTYTIP